MPSPSIAHYGTTIIETPPADGAVQRDIPHTGALAGTLRLLDIFGFEPLIENMYPGVGRQYIRRRGKPSDVDYVEFDAFTSYRAVERPASDRPRIGDTIFRLTHEDPASVLQRARAENLVTAAAGDDELAAFERGERPSLLVRGPNGQGLELARTGSHRADNHVIYVWTDPATLETAADDFCTQFGMTRSVTEPFHGLGNVLRLRRERPGISIGLLTPGAGLDLAPRWSEDIFLEAGYSHFRMGSPDKSRTLSVSRQAFPDGGDVSFVYFRDSYLELVQVHADDPAMA